MTVFYLDVSHHDWSRRGGQLGWDAIRAATSGAMIARATYGDPGGWHRSSSHHLDFHKGAKAAGFDLRGSYHNLIRGDAASMRRQVDWLRREMDAAGAVWAMADVERYDEMMTAGVFPRWSDVLRFQDAWYAADSRVMAWYLPQWVWSRSDMGSPDLRALRGPLVASRYALSYTKDSPLNLYSRSGGAGGKGWSAYGGVNPPLWQFTSSALVPGTTGGADCNAFRGSYAELRTLLTGTTEDDMTPEDMLKAKIHNDVTDADVEFRTFIRSFNNSLSRLEAGVGSLLQAPGADTEKIVAGVLAGLSPEQIAAAIPAGIVKGVADELARRMAA